MKKLEKLNNYPRKVYGLDDTENWVLLMDEKQKDAESGGKLNSFIKNYSGGIGIHKTHAQILPLKKKDYQLLDDEISGDAPKDFIRVYQYGEATRNKVNDWSKHIAKIGHKWYPLESISEHLINRIGQVIGLNMAHSQLRLAHGQIRFLSRYFLKENENLVHGAQIYSGYLLENDDHFVQEVEANKLARTFFTFQFTKNAIEFMFPDQHQEIMNHLVELLVFDAITGNNDRHFYNWAVITDILGEQPAAFSPIYDSARGLFWNRSENNIQQKFFQGKGKQTVINQTALQKYLQSSRPKIGWENWQRSKEINHFELIESISKAYPAYHKTCIRLLNSLNLQKIVDLLEVEFITFYTPQRFLLINECLKQRFTLLQHLCK